MEVSEATKSEYTQEKQILIKELINSFKSNWTGPDSKLQYLKFCKSSPPIYSITSIRDESWFHVHNKPKQPTAEAKGAFLISHFSQSHRMASELKNYAV